VNSFHSSRRNRRPFSNTPRNPAPSNSFAAPAGASQTVVEPPTPLTPEVAAEIAASPFTALGLSVPLVRAVLKEGYTVPTPIQSEVIAHLLAGRDILACAQTGTGKTAAFVLPILQRLAAEQSTGKIRVLVLTPTRELASQIADSVAVYGRYLGRGIKHTVVYGGVSQHRQEIALRNAPDILVATPGRLLDLMQQRLVQLDGVTHFVLDEADRMLDMGFVHDVKRISAAVPTKRQTLLFSATIPSSIEGLARGMLSDPVRVSVTPAVTTAEGVTQSVMFVAKADKRALLQRVLSDATVERAIVFTRTKHGANRLCEQLDHAGIGSAAIHGNKSQGARERALEAFRTGSTRVLVATDVAARGIDIDGISHVINFDLPNVAESYVHRIGRTGRAGAFGHAISFCDRDERGLLADIERFIRKRLPVVGGDAQFVPTAAEQATTAAMPAAPQRGRNGGGGSRGRSYTGSRRY
jgi:ATP-dependent RNA helicase RhlE